MLEKESDNRVKSVTLINSQNADTKISTKKGDENERISDLVDQATESELLNNTKRADDIDVEKTIESRTVPVGYQFLSEEFFQVKDIPQPLVSLSWLKNLNSDDDSGEDSIPLAKLISKRKKKSVTKSKNSVLPIESEESNDSNKKVRKRKKTHITENEYNPINRKRGRPKKQTTEATTIDNDFENSKDELFWESDLSNDVQNSVEIENNNEKEESNELVINHNEHDYFKPIENVNAEETVVEEKKEKKKKRKSVIQGVKVGDSKVSFPCLECGKSFSAASTLKCHQRIHNGTLLICPECHKGFVSKYLLKCHMRIHNGDLFMCHKCGRGFTTAELLKVHSRAHTGDRPFVCNICGKSFPTSSNMTQHKQIHNSEKKFLCSQCGSSFVQKRCLDYHMLTHAEKKNICNVCGKLWARKSDLIEHMRVHTGVKPYCCNVCPQKFSQASSLKRHQFIHMDVKPIPCKTCNKMFKCQEYYKRHLRKHEKDDFLLSDI